MTADRSQETATVSLEGQVLAVKGILTVNTLSSALKQLSCIEKMADQISFQAVDTADSTAVVFLLACQRKLNSGKLMVRDVPDRVMRLIRLYDLSTLFNFSQL